MQMLFEMQEKALLIYTQEWNSQRDKRRPYLTVPMRGDLVRTIFSNLLEEYQVVEFVCMHARGEMQTPEGFVGVLSLQTRFWHKLFRGSEHLCFAPVHPSLVNKESVHLTPEVRAQLAEQITQIPETTIDDFTPEWPGNGFLVLVKDLDSFIKSLSRFKIRDEEEFVEAAIVLAEGFIRSDDIGSMVIYYNEDAILGTAMAGTEDYFDMEASIVAEEMEEPSDEEAPAAEEAAEEAVQSAVLLEALSQIDADAEQQAEEADKNEEEPEEKPLRTGFKWRQAQKMLEEDDLTADEDIAFLPEEVEDEAEQEEEPEEE